MQKHFYIAADLLFRLRDRIRGTTARLSGEILEAAGAMDAILARVEPDFLNLGNLFQEVQAATGLFINEVILAMETIQGNKEQTGLTGIQDLAAGFVTRLDSHRQAISRNVDSFDQVIRDLAHVPRICEKADRVALLLRVIALNIGIESQGLGQSRDMFKAFVEEVYTLSDHMKDLSDHLSRDCHFLHKKHTRTLSEVRTHEAGLENLADDARKDMGASSVNVQRLMETALSAMTSVRETMRHIKSKAGEIVVAMQFHDIVRQKTEHMISAMGDAARLINPRGKIRPGGPERHQARQILMVQIAQIGEIKKEIQQAHQTITRALGSIDGYIIDIYRHIAGQGLRPGQNRSNDPFHELMESMESLKHIRTQALALGTRVHRFMEEATSAASALTGHLDTVEHIRLDLHRKALNAIVKAAHLGDMGKGIEVFAQEVNQASLETRSFADQVNAVVGDVCKRTGDLRRTGTSDEDHAMDKDRFSNGFISLEEAYNAFQDHIDAIVTRFEGIEAVLGRGRDSLGFLDGFVGDMDRVQGMIGDIADQIIPPFLADMEENAIAMGNHRYTMESERLVHDRVLGKGEDACESGDVIPETMSGDGEDKSPEKSSPDDGLGENVDLF